ncbi:MAG: hypothetical protein HFH14_00300 [Lachnospiraceae bacterium]|nr:hypothetical protein [Lachnospiraceae bacterium]
MLRTISNNTILIVLTAIGLPKSAYPYIFIIAAALIMVITTYDSIDGHVNEENNKILSVTKLIIMAVYSMLSGQISGFLVFFFFDEAKAYIRVIIGISMYVLSAAAMAKEISAAICIVETFLIIAAYLIILIVYKMMEQMENRKRNYDARITASNVSEMHEKRLNEQLTIQNYMAERNARLIERENISRNIHNNVGHSITAAIMTLDAADMLYDVEPDEARKKMNDANNRMRGSLESIRRAVRVLDEGESELTAADLTSELDMIINEFMMDTGIQINKDYCGITGAIKIPHNHVEFLTGVLREMLTNGVKHGNANEFFVILLGDSAHVRLDISDNGHSDFDSINGGQRIAGGFGLRKIITYVEKCGGKVQFENENGFRTTMELPV